MLLMTSNYCPQCDQLIYMKVYPKQKHEDSVMISSFFTEVDGAKIPHTFADGIYLDKDGVLCITRFDELTRTPDYCCILCGWES